MKRVIIIVIDSLGVGAMPDAEDYGDSLACNTLSNVATYNSGLSLPALRSLGLGNITAVQGVSAVNNPEASHGRMMEKSEGKDTTTGHWEMAGLVLDKPFQTYPKGFPSELMNRFIDESGCQGFYANCPASGTDIIDEFNEAHKLTEWPIIYTSADSVFQIACNVDVVPINRLYEWCEIARTLLSDGYNTSRVIARPYKETPSGLERISGLRKDYSVEPTQSTLLNMIANNNGRVIAVGKIEDIFVGSGITHAIHTSSNKEGLDLTLSLINRKFDLNKISLNKCSTNDIERELIFINLVDTDMLFGHRNDAAGYGSALEEIDRYIDKIIPLIGADDLLLITADHGCDPTHEGTDHTREMVPVIEYNRSVSPVDLGIKSSFTYIAYRSARWLNLADIPESWVK